MRWLLLLLFLGCGTPEPSYQVTCESVSCDEPDLVEDAPDYKRCSWCTNSLNSDVVTFRRMDGCWGVEREFEWAEGRCIEFNRF